MTTQARTIKNHVMAKPLATEQTHAPEIPSLLGFHSGTDLFLKDESAQLGGSIKGRVAHAMVIESLRLGKPIVESSSGNLALGLAYWCRRLEASTPLCLIDDCCESPIRKKLIAAGCALEEISLTPSEQSNQTGVLKRVELAARYAERGYYWPNQYGQPAWVEVHARTTGPEIWDCAIPFALIAAAVGTGATISGIAASRPRNRIARIAAIEPQGSGIFSSPTGAYRVAGAGNPFRPGNYWRDLIDDEVAVDDESTFRARAILRQSGWKIGSSGAMALVGALRVATRICTARSDPILVVIADSGWYEHD